MRMRFAFAQIDFREPGASLRVMLRLTSRKPILQLCHLVLGCCVLGACGSEEGETAAPEATTGAASTSDASSTSSDTPETEGAESGSSSSSTTGSAGSGTSDSSSGTTGTEFADAYPLPVTYPEGGAFDPIDGVFVVGTLEGGGVFSVDPDSGEAQALYEQDAPGTWITLGMAVDAERHRLWVCAADREATPFTGEIWVIDLDTGERTHAIPLSHDGAAAWCEDVAIASDGTAYATDRENPNIYVVDDRFEAELLVSDELLGSPVLGQNGIVVLPGDEALLAAIHAPPSLNHVSISDGAITPVEISGDFTDTGLGVGADGMVWVNDALFVVFDGKLARVTPTTDDWSQAESTTVEWPRGLTDVLSTPAGLYLLNGQAIQFALGQRPLGPFELRRFDGMF